MEFFNKKEDVIDLQLTQFGRHLLSKGQLKPKFYSFFDDNILYDSMKAGHHERQNDSEERIKETQTMRPQVCFSSLEKEFNTSYDLVLSGQADAQKVVQQKTAEKNYSLAQPMGTSDINSEYAPSWTVRYLNGYLSGSASHLELQEKNGGKINMPIPQLETKVEIKVKEFPADDPGFDELLDGPALSDIVVVSDEKDYYVLLKLMENNGSYQKKNFDIEIFEVVDQKEGTKTIEVLRPLYFSKVFNPENELEMLDNMTPEDSEDHVAHYFNLRLDDEIDPAILCEHDPANPKLGVFADERAVLCQDVLNQQEKTVFNIYEEGTKDIPGDIC